MGVEVFAAREGLVVELGGELTPWTWSGGSPPIVLGAVFVVAGAAKLAAGSTWIAQARQMGATQVVATVVPGVELVLGAVLVHRHRHAAAGARRDRPARGVQRG